MEDRPERSYSQWQWFEGPFGWGPGLPQSAAAKPKMLDQWMQCQSVQNEPIGPSGLSRLQAMVPPVLLGLHQHSQRHWWTLLQHHCHLRVVWGQPQPYASSVGAAAVGVAPE